MGKKITHRTLDSLRPENDKDILREDGGLVGVVRRGEGDRVSVSFRWRYRFDGKLKDIRVGTWPKSSLADIRKERDQAKRTLEEGNDPSTARKANKLRKRITQQSQLAELEQQAARATVQDLFDRWASLELSQRKESSREELLRAFRKDVLPVIGALPAEDVTRANVMKVLDNILARGARRLANRTLSEMRQMFGFGYVRDIIKHDPTHRIKKTDVGGKEVERTRALSEVEIGELARKVSGANLLVTTECAIWIMLATGIRIGDLMKATWDEIDFAARAWTFTPEKDKTHIQRTHTVFLSDFALRQFECLRSINGGSPWLYPDTTGTRPVCKKSVTKQIGDRQRTEALQNRSKLTGSLVLSGGPWTPHDLRRTCATLIRSLGFNTEVADRLIYHIEQDRLKRIYQRHDLEGDMREAWIALGERLDLLTREDAGNVVILPLKRASL